LTPFERKKSSFARSLETLGGIMAPTILFQPEETLKAIENVLKRHRNTSRILKEKEKQMLSGEDYQHMEVDLNQKQLLQPLDSDNTKANIYYIRQKFIRYTRPT
jgi:hypothetical protein